MIGFNVMQLFIPLRVGTRCPLLITPMDDPDNVGDGE